MLIGNLARQLTNDKWEEPKRNNVIEGITFDLYATRHHISFWQACFTSSQEFLDQETFQRFERIYKILNEKARSWTWANFTVLVVLALKGVSQDVTRKVDKYSAGMAFTKAGGCLLCIVDVLGKVVHMKTPSLPIPLHVISKEFKDTVNRALAIPW